MKKNKPRRKYKQLSKEERSEIEILFNKKYKLSEIARSLKRHKSTISREIKKNRRKIRTKKGTKDGHYEAIVAKHKAYLHRKYAKYQGKKINENQKLYNYIIQSLQNGWSPEVISGRMRQDGQPFYASKTAIYEYLYSSNGQFLCKYLPSKKYRPKKQKKNKTKKTLIPYRIGINQRPETINNKETYGHFEGDTIVSGKRHQSKYALTVIYERKAKYLDVRKIKTLKPTFHNQAIKNMSQKLVVDNFFSLTFDNGIENTKHQELQKELKIDTYFCDPYSAWQKPGIENANKLIRNFIPKGSDIKNYSPQYIAYHINRRNRTPRKSLNYLTPYEVMMKNNLLKIKLNKNTPSVALRG